MSQLAPGLARIRIKDLRLRTYIGIKEEEILNQQDILINATILYPADDAVSVNQIEQALNYRTITKAMIRHVEENRFALLERLTQELLIAPAINLTKPLVDLSNHTRSIGTDKGKTLLFTQLSDRILRP